MHSHNFCERLQRCIVYMLATITAIAVLETMQHNDLCIQTMRYKPRNCDTGLRHYLCWIEKLLIPWPDPSFISKKMHLQTNWKHPWSSVPNSWIRSKIAYSLYWGMKQEYRENGIKICLITLSGLSKSRASCKPFTISTKILKFASCGPKNISTYDFKAFLMSV